MRQCIRQRTGVDAAIVCVCCFKIEVYRLRLKLRYYPWIVRLKFEITKKLPTLIMVRNHDLRRFGRIQLSTWSEGMIMRF